MKHTCQYCNKKFPKNKLVYGYFTMCLPDLKLELDHLAFYDQLQSTVGKGHVCASCLELESKINEEYEKLII